LLQATSQLLSNIEVNAEIHVLVAHGAVKGAQFDNGTESKSGIENKALRKLAESYDYTVFGDFHRHQTLGTSAWYTGSVIQSSLRDAGQAKCFQIIDIDDGNWGILPYNVGPYFISRSEKDMNKKLPKKEHIHLVIKVGSREDNDPEEIRTKMMELGAERVFVDTESNQTDRSSKVISIAESRTDWLENYVKIKQDELPADKELVLQRGKAYMESII
jgi:hypothetical protein